jgi:hypothetical protein
LTDSSGADDSSRDELAIPPLKLLPPSLERAYTTSTTIIREIAGATPYREHLSAKVLVLISETSDRSLRPDSAFDQQEQFEKQKASKCQPIQPGKFQTVNAGEG